MNGNVGTTWALLPRPLRNGAWRQPLCRMLCDSIGHRTRKTYFGNGGMEKPTEPTAGRGLSSIADALGDDASVVETVIADRERKLSGPCRAGMVR